MTQCFQILGLDKPRVRGKTQDEIDQALADWKDDVLKKAWRKRAGETHPDRNPTDEAAQQFKDVQDAYEQVRKDLKAGRLKKPVTGCPSGHPRLPATAKYCHECGHCYVTPALEQRLRNVGLTPSTIAALRADGTYQRLEAMSPASPALQDEIKILFHRQRLGLFGKYSGWG
jgi:hypothetical protein